MFHLISSSRSIIVFEAAARTGSFTRAASELKVSQPAVSRQIRELEAALGCRLFHRTGNSVGLTRSGEQLHEAVREGLGRISTAMFGISSIWKSSSITIRSHMELVTYFLMPALNGAEELDVNYSLEILTYRRGKVPDFEGPGIAILYGDGNWPGYRADRILDDALFPVCSGETFQRLDKSLHNARRHDEPLLQLDGYLDEMMDWSRWDELFPSERLGSLPKRHFSDYEVLVQACRTGRGIALGSICVVAPYLKSGDLIRISNYKFDTQYGYYLVYDPLIVEVARFRKLLGLLKRRAADYADEITRVLSSAMMTPDLDQGVWPFKPTTIEF
ncbi:LysR family transcriptional regulator [Labrys neptuniae]